MLSQKFIRKYMRMAKHVGEDQNPCHSRQIGTVLVDPIRNKILGTGYNGPARGTPHTSTRTYLENIVWPQLTANEREIALASINREDAPPNCLSEKDLFLHAYSDCKTCPRRLIGAKSGERTELCSCLSPESQVQLADGSWARIAELVASRYAGLVRTCSFDEEKMTTRKVTGWFQFPLTFDRWYEFDLEHDHGQRWARFTPDHLLMTNVGWRRADEIRLGNLLLVANGENETTPLANPFAQGTHYDIVRTVVTVPRAEGEDFSYCLEIDGTHNFVAGGLVVRNCEHSERNAIFNAACDLHGAWLFGWCGVACWDCTKAIIQAGVEKCYFMDWGADYSRGSRWLFSQAGVDVVVEDPEYYLGDD